MGCQNGGTELFEIFLVIVGAILGFVLSIFTTIVKIINIFIIHIILM